MIKVRALTCCEATLKILEGHFFSLQIKWRRYFRLERRGMTLSDPGCGEELWRPWRTTKHSRLTQRLDAPSCSKAAAGVWFRLFTGFQSHWWVSTIGTFKHRMSFYRLLRPLSCCVSLAQQPGRLSPDWKFLPALNKSHTYQCCWSCDQLLFLHYDNFSLTVVISWVSQKLQPAGGPAAVVVSLSSNWPPSDVLCWCLGSINLTERWENGDAEGDRPSASLFRVSDFLDFKEEIYIVPASSTGATGQNAG